MLNRWRPYVKTGKPPNYAWSAVLKRIISHLISLALQQSQLLAHIAIRELSEKNLHFNNQWLLKMTVNLCRINYAKIEKLRDKNSKINRDFRIREKDRMAHFMIDDNRICHGIALLSDYRQINNNQETPNNQSVRQFQSVKQCKIQIFVREPHYDVQQTTRFSKFFWPRSVPRFFF